MRRRKRRIVTPRDRQAVPAVNFDDPDEVARAIREIFEEWREECGLGDTVSYVLRRLDGSTETREI